MSAIDVQQVVGAELPEREASWDADDVILYHLGLNAGADPTSGADLSYVYERELKVLPTWGVLHGLGSLFDMLQLEGMDVSLAQLLHGEQDVEVHEALPVAGSVRTSTRITGVYDKGKGALVVLQAVTRDASDGRPLVTSTYGAFLRGAGGFGGESGPAPGNAAPEREPDAVVACPTLPQQALIYRLSGDKNPLHADPEFAASAGFDRPILHGLCSYGIACRAVVDHVLGGDVTQVAGFGARFAGVVFPGETIEVSCWREDGAVLLSARCAERDTPVLSNAAVRLR